MEIGAVLYSVFSILGIIFYVVVAASAIYVVLIVLKRMRERNEYLREIRDELRKRNEN